MDATTQTTPPEHGDCLPVAWQPLTPSGVAAFASATLGRLTLVQTVFALAAAAAIGWFLLSAWCPSITAAIEQLPMEGNIRNGTLDWRGSRSQLLSESRFLGFLVDLDRDGEQRTFADLRFEFGRRTLRVASLAGHMDFAYPRNYSIRFNRAELLPLWGAWMPWLLILTGIAVFVVLLVCWALFAFVYTIPTFIGSRVARRRAGLVGIYKLAGASQMPGALLITLAIIGYGAGAVDLLRLSVAFAMHFALSWIYLALAVVCLPKRSAASQGSNPFSAAPEAVEDESPPDEADSSNPFKAPRNNSSEPPK